VLAILNDDGYELSSDPSRIDIEQVHRWLYAKLGFTALAQPDRWMELDRRQTSVTAITSKEQIGDRPLTVRA
jgi:hypothetical protein